MNGRLSFRIFAHSWISDWNHGNAHFLRGLASELVKLGHEVRCYEERKGWSITNLASEGKDAVGQAEADFHQAFPNLDVREYARDRGLAEFLRSELAGADVVIVHEWNPARLASEILALRPNLGFRVLFHDTHHRAYTSPAEMLRFPLGEFDGVLAFGETIQKIYRDAFGVKRVWTFHEAADTDHFSPQSFDKDTDVAWIGNWGDEERTREIEEFLITPAAALGDYRFAVHGVRYPSEALQKLAEARIEFRGYLPNLRAPQIYARSRISLHVPRRFYANGLSGIPTIRVFEALAAGSPLVCAPWIDSEGLFRPGEDYVCVSDSQAMISELKHLLRDDKAREQMAASGLEAIRARHTCAHRAEQLVEICSDLARSSEL
ncbi:MAG: glycosyltransferase [Acidobacteria bacterium]|nr:MAG: glycosyltransferase [Acidobacteriota bacterium]